MISCTKENVPFIGLIDIPIMKQRWIGGIGAGVFLNGRKCQNIKIKNSLKDSIVSLTSTLMFDTKDSLKVKEIYQKTRFLFWYRIAMLTDFCFGQNRLDCRGKPQALGLHGTDPTYQRVWRQYF